MSEATTGVAGGERLGEHHAEALAVQRGRAQHLGLGELGQLARLGDLAERVHAAVVEHHVRDLLRGGADERERRRDLLAQRLERAQQHRQALAFDGLADEQDPQRTVGLALRIGLTARTGSLGPRWTPLGTIR